MNKGFFHRLKSQKGISLISVLIMAAFLVAALNAYKAKNGQFPTLPSGSYLPNKTVSVWPSWQANLSRQLGGNLPGDPVNKLGSCAANYDATTCWDEQLKNFATNFTTPVLPSGSLAYAYQVNANSNVYNLCANFETGYDGLPQKNICNGSAGNTRPVILPIITLGKFQSSEGQFKDYFQVDSLYPIDWTSVKLTANWSDWAVRGWLWWPGLNTLRVDNTKVKNQKAITAADVNLPKGKDYDSFNLGIAVSDIYGNTGLANGDILICNALSCSDQGAECGNVPDGCGGTLICGDCQDPNKPDCVNNRCLKL